MSKNGWFNNWGWFVVVQLIVVFIALLPFIFPSASYFEAVQQWGGAL